MTRRDLLRLGGSSLLYATLSPLSGLGAAGIGGRSSDRWIYFSPEDIALIRANTRTPLLRPLYQQWASTPPDALLQLMQTFEASGNMNRDMLRVLMGLTESATVQLVSPTAPRQRAILEVMDRLLERAYWDYFRDGDDEVIGIQRASLTTVSLLYIREVLGTDFGKERERRLLEAIADKGCAPCSRAIQQMDRPEIDHGWGVDETHADIFDLSLERWPMILGANNLRSVPTGALGMAALALLGHDPRAEEWLATATASMERFFKLFSPDGGYFEGLPYLSYSLRTALPFIDAHRRLDGSVDWSASINWDGTLDYILYMQMGRRPDGRPDIVNFSDGRESVFPGAISRLSAYSDNPLVGYAAQHAGAPESFLDFLWYQPEAPIHPPPAELRNIRTDLNWVISRSGWKPDDAVVAFRSGAPANHEHADRNHITFKMFGERLLNDHFGASYDRQNPGWKLRLTEAHNCVLIDGKGHTYIDGTEGVNDSKAFATLLQYADHGEHVWWTSDASAAYLLDNYHLQQVLRTVLFAKPNVLVVIDQVRFRYRPQTVDARFFPDNADGLASLAVKGERFTLTRPQAQLHGLVVADTDAKPRRTRLDVPPETGHFPCIEVHSPAALDHRIVTILTATPGADSVTPQSSVTREQDRWEVTAGHLRAVIRMSAHAPRIEIL